MRKLIPQKLENQDVHVVLGQFIKALGFDL